MPYRLGISSHILNDRNHVVTNTLTEISPNNRAGCKATDCKDKGVKILKGELRQATQITIHEHQSWVYRHWYVDQLTPVGFIADTR